MSPKNNQNPAKTKPQVKFYSGYKSKETPRAIVIKGKEHIIKIIKEQKRILDSKTGETFNRFVCQTDNKTFIIKVPEFHLGSPERKKMAIKIKFIT
jgi:hypothetical protein